MGYTFTIILGRLLCRQFRDYLATAKLHYPSLQWHEESGWIERTFHVVGSAEAITQVSADAQRWVAALKAE